MAKSKPNQFSNSSPFPNNEGCNSSGNYNLDYLPPIKAIREKCLDCVVYQPLEVRLCPTKECPLHPYRFGTNPKRKGIGKKANLNSRKGKE